MGMTTYASLCRSRRLHPPPRLPRHSRKAAESMKIVFTAPFLPPCDWVKVRLEGQGIPAMLKNEHGHIAAMAVIGGAATFCRPKVWVEDENFERLARDPGVTCADPVLGAEDRPRHLAADPTAASAFRAADTLARRLLRPVDGGLLPVAGTRAPGQGTYRASPFACLGRPGCCRRRMAEVVAAMVGPSPHVKQTVFLLFSLAKRPDGSPVGSHTSP